MNGRLQKYLAEAIGTFILVFAGTSAIVVNELRAGAVGNLGIALTFGFVVAAMIYTLGDISGAHLNPAVTLGFWCSRRLEGREVAPYLFSQLSGALLASGMVRVLFGSHNSLGVTVPSGSIGQSFLLELILTFILMLTAINVSTGAKEKGLMAGVAVGSVIALEAIFAGPISGASMNPVRSFAPALVSGHLALSWIYLVAPVAGSLLAIVACRGLRGRGCC
jgi:aquaporin NIP